MVERDESIQPKILEIEFNRRRLAAEKEAFEPEFFGGATREVSERENSI